jgi:hypothetical protein
MATVGCLRCGVWYDPAKPHLCGLLADETARALAERLDAFERRLQGLEGEAREKIKGADSASFRRVNALERRVEELEAALADDGSEKSEPSPETVSESKTPEGAGSEISERSPNEAGRGACDLGAFAPPASEKGRKNKSQQATSGANAPPEPAARPRFDRKANHRRYMRAWRARQTSP